MRPPRYWKEAVNAEMDRDDIEGDPRLLAQRRADAADELRAPRLDPGDVGTVAAVWAHLVIVADLDALSGATPELIAAACGEVRTGGLSAATLERLSSDCDISRVTTKCRS